MLIREWMTKDVISVTPETSMLKASKLLKDHGIRRLPVVDDAKNVVGIVSDRDVKAASPSKATTLDMHELYYLLSEIKIKDIMTPKPYTIRDNETVEMAAVLMEEHNFGGLPVVNAENKLVGIITDHDIFTVLIDISGARHGGIQLAFLLPDERGVLCPIFDSLREFGANVLSVLTSRNKSQSGTSRVYIRLHPMEPGEEKKLLESMKKTMPLEYWVDDEMHPL